MEFRYRPKNSYLHQASWQELYVLAEHWKSDIEFYRDELRFLRQLVDKYFMWLIHDENIDRVKKLADLLSGTDNWQEQLSDKINKHLKHLEELSENPFAYDEQQFREEHAALEDEIAKFVRSCREVKRQTFDITENVIETEKIKHLLAK